MAGETERKQISVAEALTRAGRPRVMFGLPSRDEVKMDYCLSLCGMMVRMAIAVEIMPANPRSCYIQINRNDVVRSALEHRADYIMWIDADVESLDPDAVMRLLAHNVDIVGGTYARRSPPYQLMGRKLDRSGSAVSLEGLERMEHLPAGFLLTKTSVYQKIAPPWFWVTHKPDGSADLGDDYYFCDKAIKAGLTVWHDAAVTANLVHHASVGLKAKGNDFPEVAR